MKSLVRTLLEEWPGTAVSWSRLWAEHPVSLWRKVLVERVVHMQA